MKVFTSDDFTGHWPVGTAAVVVAENKQSARLLLIDALVEQGLLLPETLEANEDEEFFTLKEVDMAEEHCLILHDGEY